MRGPENVDTHPAGAIPISNYDRSAALGFRCVKDAE